MSEQPTIHILGTDGAHHEIDADAFVRVATNYMKTSATVRISSTAHKALSELAETEKVPMQTVLDRAIENYRRNRFLDAVNAQFAALRETESWKTALKERDDWSRTASAPDSSDDAPAKECVAGVQPSVPNGENSGQPDSGLRVDPVVGKG